MKKLKFVIKKPIGGHTPGTVINLSCSDDGTPLDRFWFRRFKDSSIDDCMARVADTLPQTTKKKEEKPNE